jgi:hypothetical protein
LQIPSVHPQLARAETFPIIALHGVS